MKKVKDKPAKIEISRGGEGSAGDLFGVEAIGADERAVLIGGKSSGECLGGEVVAEAGEIVKVDDVITVVCHVIRIKIEIVGDFDFGLMGRWHL